MSQTKHILLTNDDGVHSPGLWAAAHALSALGRVTVAAPWEQATAAGRSLSAHSTGRIHLETVRVQDIIWQAYGIEGTPAQVVQHALLELMPAPPDLLVSGINYGENVGSGVTISGTVGAALEAASFGIPALAVSLEMDIEHHTTHSAEVDFSAAAFFTHKFAQQFLDWPFPPEVDVFKVEVPRAATPHTPWRITRLSRTRYYEPIKPARANLHDPGKMGYRRALEPDKIEPDSDVRALLEEVVSVTPLSLDLTARVNLTELSHQLG